MFNLKDMYQMQAKAREVQQKLADEIIAVTKQGTTIKMNGKQEVLSVTLNPELEKQGQEQVLVEAFNQAIQDAQKLMAKQMMG